MDMCKARISGGMCETVAIETVADDPQLDTFLAEWGDGIHPRLNTLRQPDGSDIRECQAHFRPAQTTPVLNPN